jgi:GNAT superfamily N-acetyltransferase
VGEPPAWVVRRASEADVGALADLRWAWRAVEQGAPRMDNPEFTSAFERWFLAHRTTHEAFLAEVGSSSVGMAWLALIERVPGPDRWARHAGHLQSVYVLPEHRNKGIGGALVMAALRQAAAHGLDYVIVHPSERSFPLYRRLGFRETGAVLEIDLRTSLPR